MKTENCTNSSSSTMVGVNGRSTITKYEVDYILNKNKMNPFATNAAQIRKISGHGSMSRIQKLLVAIRQDRMSNYRENVNLTLADRLNAINAL